MTSLEMISFLQRKIILNSILYYNYNRTKMSDKDFDKCCKELVELTKQVDNPEASQYWYCFYDFDGSTGFDLVDRLNESDKEYLTKLALWM